MRNAIIDSRRRQEMRNNILEAQKKALEEINKLAKEKEIVNKIQMFRKKLKNNKTEFTRKKLNYSFRDDSKNILIDIKAEYEREKLLKFESNKNTNIVENEKNRREQKKFLFNIIYSKYVPEASDNPEQKYKYYLDKIANEQDIFYSILGIDQLPKFKQIEQNKNDFISKTQIIKDSNPKKFPFYRNDIYLLIEKKRIIIKEIIEEIIGANIYPKNYTACLANLLSFLQRSGVYTPPVTRQDVVDPRLNEMKLFGYSNRAVLPSVLLFNLPNTKRSSSEPIESDIKDKNTFILASLVYKNSIRKIGVYSDFSPTFGTDIQRIEFNIYMKMFLYALNFNGVELKIVNTSIFDKSKSLRTNNQDPFINQNETLSKEEELHLDNYNDFIFMKSLPFCGFIQKNPYITKFGASIDRTLNRDPKQLSNETFVLKENNKTKNVNLDTFLTIHRESEDFLQIYLNKSEKLKAILNKSGLKEYIILKRKGYTQQDISREIFEYITKKNNVFPRDVLSIYNDINHFLVIDVLSRLYKTMETRNDLVLQCSISPYRNVFYTFDQFLKDKNKKLDQILQMEELNEEYKVLLNEVLPINLDLNLKEEAFILSSIIGEDISSKAEQKYELEKTKRELSELIEVRNELTRKLNEIKKNININDVKDKDNHILSKQLELRLIRLSHNEKKLQTSIEKMEKMEKVNVDEKQLQSQMESQKKIQLEDAKIKSNFSAIVLKEVDKLIEFLCFFHILDREDFVNYLQTPKKHVSIFKERKVDSSEMLGGSELADSLIEFYKEIRKYCEDHINQLYHLSFFPTNDPKLQEIKEYDEKIISELICSNHIKFVNELYCHVMYENLIVKIEKYVVGTKDAISNDEFTLQLVIQFGNELLKSFLQMYDLNKLLYILDFKPVTVLVKKRINEKINTYLDFDLNKTDAKRKEKFLLEIYNPKFISIRNYIVRQYSLYKVAQDKNASTNIYPIELSMNENERIKTSIMNIENKELSQVIRISQL